MTQWTRATRLGLWMIGALASLSSSKVGAQVVLTSVTTMSLGANKQPNGAYTDAQGSGSCCANTYITRGTNPTTDAFLYTGNDAGSLFPAGITLSTGLNTFYLWGSTGLVGTPNYAVALFTGSTALTVSSYWDATTNTNSGVGMKVYGDPNPFGPQLDGVGLSAILGNFQLTITDWRPEVVVRNVSIQNFGVGALTTPVANNVGRLVLNVVDLTTGTPPVSTVPEPSTYLLMACGLVSLGVMSRRRRASAT